jgi:hypothetical protein
MRRAPALLVASLAAAAALTAARPARAAAEDGHARTVEPVRAGSELAAHLRTQRLPGASILASLDSGMPSAIEFRLEARDERDRTVAENDVLYRIVFDLWDEVFRLQGGGAAASFADADALERFLTDLPRVPVTPVGGLAAGRRHRIGVACRLHVIAPRETEELEQWVAGAPDREEAGDGREISIGLGDVIRFFYKGGKRGEDFGEERFSPWFVPDALPDEAAAGGGAGGEEASG